jgi:N utilization substance protein B
MSSNPGKPAPKKRPYRGKRRGPGAFGKGAYVERSSVRHQGRVLAMQTLFEIDNSDHDVEEVIGRIRHDDTILPDSALETADTDEQAVDDVPAEVADHAEKLTRGTLASLGSIDPVLAEAAPAFPIAQIAAVDRSVLRLAIYELYYQHDVPVGVAINEAVEIAKRFGGPNSSRFVNGVLGTISKQLPAERG